MGALDLTIGCLLFSSWANMVLFTLQLKQTYKYFSNYPNDIWFNKGSVLVALASDTMTVIAVLASVYLIGASDQTYLESQPWCIPVYIIGTGTTATVVQVWLTRMVWNLTRQWWWIPIIGGLIATGTVGAGATAGQLFRDSSYAGRFALVKYVTIWLSGCAAADTIITGALVWKFRTIKTTFVDTKDLLRRLSIAAVRNGSITTVMTIITIIVFKSRPEDNTAVMIEMTIGRIYTTSMLSNLNNRILMTGDSSDRSSQKRTAGVDTHGNPSTVVCIRQDIETHYQSDADAIPMGKTAYGARKGDLESADGASDREVGLVVHVQGEKHEF
ncbi:hypothetical protein DFH08DRAFT_1049688 [Mycena albidolilacea]|uniref:DUF6534 domain-containing protein n=1 Tax=Mycena albidolilacea TaxID=1033008 RepID=A0AAD6Z634_9AGAR|nr:hypothetical protein DFH08DRAFT_1049688 [Mycena albidolilacea]